MSERTADLTAARDRAKAAQAQAGERAKSEFLATMSHEVRTPLNAIVGFCDLLREETSLTQSQRRCVEQMRVGCEVLTSVVNDILDYRVVHVRRHGGSLTGSPCYDFTWVTRVLFPAVESSVLSPLKRRLPKG